MESTLKNKITGRHRGENWSQDEKDILIEIMRQSAPIIESKLTDTNTNKQKSNEWLKVQKRLEELSGKRREVTQIKGFWRRMKQIAKTNVAKHKNLKLTGGGDHPQSPSEEDKQIMELCPTDFICEKNEYDSDAIYVTTANQVIEQEASKVVESEKYIIDIELNNSCDNEVNLSLIDDFVSLPEENPTEVLKENKENLINKTQLKTISNIKRKPKRSQLSYKSSIIYLNLEAKKRQIEMLEGEYLLKIKYHKRELSHQELRHKLELDLLLLEKEKKELEIKMLKNP